MFNTTHTVFLSPCLSGGEKETAYQSSRRRASTPFPQILTASMLAMRCRKARTSPHNLLTTCNRESPRMEKCRNCHCPCLSVSVYENEGRSLPAVCTPLCPVSHYTSDRAVGATSFLSVHSAQVIRGLVHTRPYGPTILNPPVKSLHEATIRNHLTKRNLPEQGNRQGNKRVQENPI